MTTPNGSPTQGISRGTPTGASDAATQAAAGEAKVLGTDQDDASGSADGAAAQRNRIQSQMGGNPPAAGPTVTR